MSQLRKMAAATTWCVGTRTVKLSFAGSAWARGNPTALHGAQILQSETLWMQLCFEGPPSVERKFSLCVVILFQVQLQSL